MKGGKQAISLTEEMVYEMNRSGSTGYSGLDAAYHNYGLQGGDMESWKSDKYSQQGRYKRGSSSSSGGGTERQGRGHDRGEGPYQSGLYDRLAKTATVCSFQICVDHPNNVTCNTQLEDGMEPDLPRLPDHPLPSPNLILHDKRRQEVSVARLLHECNVYIVTTPRPSYEDDF